MKLRYCALITVIVALGATSLGCASPCVSDPGWFVSGEVSLAQGASVGEATHVNIRVQSRPYPGWDMHREDIEIASITFPYTFEISRTGSAPDQEVMLEMWLSTANSDEPAGHVQATAMLDFDQGVSACGVSGFTADLTDLELVLK